MFGTEGTVSLKHSAENRSIVFFCNYVSASTDLSCLLSLYVVLLGARYHVTFALRRRKSVCLSSVCDAGARYAEVELFDDLFDSEFALNQTEYRLFKSNGSGT